MTFLASDDPSRRRVLGSLAAIPAIQALHGTTAAQAQTAAVAPDHVTAIDIALEPDATMIRHAKAATSINTPPRSSPVRSAQSPVAPAQSFVALAAVAVAVARP